MLSDVLEVLTSMDETVARAAEKARQGAMNH